jgi:hypothetical protein
VIVLLLLADLALPTQLAIPADLQSLFPPSLTAWHIEWSKGAGQRCANAQATVTSGKAAFDDVRPKLKKLGFSVDEIKPGILLLGTGSRGNFSAIYKNGTVLVTVCPQPLGGVADVLQASPLGKEVGDLIRELGLSVRFAIYGQVGSAKPDLSVQCELPAQRTAVESALKALKFTNSGALWRQGDISIFFGDKELGIYAYR